MMAPQSAVRGAMYNDVGLLYVKIRMAAGTRQEWRSNVARPYGIHGHVIVSYSLQRRAFLSLLFLSRPAALPGFPTARLLRCYHTRLGLPSLRPPAA
jgi:hypothetical protein